jgi:hypothetical protein
MIMKVAADDCELKSSCCHYLTELKLCKENSVEMLLVKIMVMGKCLLNEQ